MLFIVQVASFAQLSEVSWSNRGEAGEHAFIELQSSAEHGSTFGKLAEQQQQPSVFVTAGSCGNMLQLSAPMLQAHAISARPLRMVVSMSAI